MTNDDWRKWSTVVAGVLGSAASCGVISSYVFGLFIKAISAEYGWHRSETTLSITCFYVFVGLGALSLGTIISRWNIRTPTLLFVLVFAGSLASVAILPPSVLLLSILFSAMGFFGAGSNPMPYAIAIAGWFDRNRGLALAIAVSGTGLSSIFMARYANWLMENYGWRGGYVGVALFVAVFGFAALLLFFREPPREVHGERGALSLWQICTRDRTFWILAISIFLISVALLGVVTNLAPILTDKGMTTRQVAALLSLLGGATWASRLGLGLLLDRIHVRLISVAIFLMVATGTVLVLSDIAWSRETGVLLIGIGMGAEADILTYAVSRYFGPRELGKAIGGVWTSWAWGCAAGVLLGSASFDLFGSYSVAMIAKVPNQGTSGVWERRCSYVR
jgi:predicted MFS family arabinose efflux permease